MLDRAKKFCLLVSTIIEAIKSLIEVIKALRDFFNPGDDDEEE